MYEYDGEELIRAGEDYLEEREDSLEDIGCSCDPPDCHKHMTADYVCAVLNLIHTSCRTHADDGRL